MDSASPISRAVSPASPPPPAESASLLERAFQDALLLPDESVMGTEIDETRVRLLDAAYEQFCRTGIQRSSMEEIARRVPLSKIARPAWDLQQLASLGLNAEADETVWKRVWSEEETISFASTPMFLVRGRK